LPFVKKRAWLEKRSKSRREKRDPPSVSRKKAGDPPPEGSENCPQKITVIGKEKKGRERRWVDRAGNERVLRLTDGTTDTDSCGNPCAAEDRIGEKGKANNASLAGEGYQGGGNGKGTPHNGGTTPVDLWGLTAERELIHTEERRNLGKERTNLPTAREKGDYEVQGHKTRPGKCAGLTNRRGITQRGRSTLLGRSFEAEYKPGKRVKKRGTARRCWYQKR